MRLRGGPLILSCQKFEKKIRKGGRNKTGVKPNFHRPWIDNLDYRTRFNTYGTYGFTDERCEDIPRRFCCITWLIFWVLAFSIRFG